MSIFRENALLVTGVTVATRVAEACLEQRQPLVLGLCAQT
jgi:hypothetical protein